MPSKGLHRPWFSLLKFDFLKSDQQKKEYFHSSKKVRQPPIEPAHKRVEKSKAKSAVRSTAEVESEMVPARTGAVRTIAEIAKVRAWTEDAMKSASTATAAAPVVGRMRKRIEAAKSNLDELQAKSGEGSPFDFLFEDKDGNLLGSKEQLRKIVQIAGVILVILFVLSAIFDRPATNPYATRSTASTSSTSKKYSSPEISGMSGKSSSESSSSSSTKTTKTSALPVNRIFEPTEWEKDNWKKNEDTYRGKAKEYAEFDMKHRRDRLKQILDGKISATKVDTSGYYYHIVISSEQYMRDAWKDAGFTQEEIELMVKLAKEYTPEQ